MNGAMFIGTWLSLVPPLLAILLAFVTKEVYSSLFIGSADGVLPPPRPHPSPPINANRLPTCVSVFIFYDSSCVFNRSPLLDLPHI